MPKAGGGYRARRCQCAGGVVIRPDGDWAVMRRDGADIYALGSGVQVERPIETVDASAAMVDKGNYRHFMAKEIHEQPDVLSRTFGQYIDPEANGVLLPKNDLDFSPTGFV